ncbi:MAG: TIM barrel protein [Tetrasphaera sp.]
MTTPAASPSAGFILAASAEMLFPDLPVRDRIIAIRDRGFHVEIWDWRGHDIDELERLHADGVTFTSMTGYTIGNLGDPQGADELLRTAAESIAIARRIGAWALNLHGTGLDNRGLPVVALPAGTEATPQMWECARHTLGRIAELGEREQVTFVLENLNLAVDHPGTPFARAADTLDLVSGVDSPHLKLNLDLYHAQIGEGNLIELCRAALPWIGEIQVADVPGRCEPGTGEINYAGVARALADMGYRGVVGMEAFASTDSGRALARFREAFTL